MIQIDLALAIALFLFLVILLVISKIIFYNFNNERNQSLESAYLNQCPFCTYLFFDYTNENVKICPRCESYIATEEKSGRGSGELPMNPLKKLDNNEGVVLITVVIVVIVMMILTVSLISITVSQNISNQHQIERIQAEQLAKGSMWFNYMNLYSGGLAAVPAPVTLAGRVYTPTVNPGPGAPDTGPDGTDPYTITVTCTSGCQ